MPELTDAYALIIGIAHYATINPLPETVPNDARAVREVLIDPTRGGYAPERVNLLLDKAATQAALRKALDDLAKTTTAHSTVLIYLSSHGGRLDSGPYKGDYILPVDVDYASAKRLAQTAISSDEMTRALRAISARKLLVIFDCCHSGGIGQPKDPTGPVLKGGLSDATYVALQTGRGRVIIASSRDDESSWVLSGAENSLFTTHLLSGLNGGIASADGLIRVFDLYNYVQPKVTADQPNQHPIFKGELEDNFPVALYPQSKAPQPTLTPAASPSASKGDAAYDVFIAYAEADKKWVKAELLPRLEDAGLKTCVFPRDLAVGAVKIDEQERAVRESRHTLLVLTPAFLANEWNEFTGALAQTLDVAARKRRVIPLLKEACDLPLRLDFLVPADFTDPDEIDNEWRKLIAALGATPSAAPSKATAAPTKPAAPKYNTAALREWLDASLSSAELDDLCFYHFPQVHNDFSSGMTRTQKTRNLIEHCVKHNRIPELIQRVNDINPAQYERYRAKINDQ